MIKKITAIVLLMSSFSLVYSQIDFTKVTQTIGSDLKVVDIGDINNDGLNDIVVGAGFYFDDINDYHIFIYYQNTNGTISNPIKVKYPDSYPGLDNLHISDVNNDGLNDVIIGYSDSIGIYYQNQQGGLDPIESYFSGYGVDGLKTGDLNNDGLNDIAVCHWNDAFIKVFYQTDTGAFNIKSYPFGNSGRDELDVSDVNNDGLDDIIYMPGQGSTGTLHIFYQDSILGITDSASTLNYEFEYSKTFNGIGTGDLNGDNRIDIVGAIGGNTAAIVLLMQDSINNIFDNPIQLPAYDIPTPVEINDLNCDSNNEIIVGHSGWGSVTIYQKDSTNTFNDYIRFRASYNYNPYSMAIGDINSDNKPDIVTVGSTTVEFLYNSSKPTNFSKIDTSVLNLKTEIDTVEYSFNYQVATIDSSSDCHIRDLFYYKVNSSIKHESYIGDSARIRFGEICGNEFVDTILVGFNYRIETIINSDTIKTLISKDTIVYDYHLINSFYLSDTIDMWTELEINTQRLEDVSISNDTVIIAVDSIEITNRTLFINLIDSYFNIYEGIKCNQQHIDTLLSNTNEWTDMRLIYTDTIILSHSVERYPSISTSISDYLDYNFTFYPNPAHDYLNIEFSKRSSKNGEMRIFNLHGEVLIQKKLDVLNTIRIDISNLKAECYIIEILTENKKLIGKFIKN